MIYIPPGQQLCQSLPILISNFLIPPTTKFSQAAFLLGVGASSSAGHSHFLVDVNADTIPLRKLVKNLLTLEVLSVACYLNGTRSAPHTTPHIRRLWSANTPKHYQMPSAIFFAPWVTSTSGRSIQQKLLYVRLKNVSLTFTRHEKRGWFGEFTDIFNCYFQRLGDCLSNWIVGVF